MSSLCFSLSLPVDVLKCQNKRICVLVFRNVGKKEDSRETVVYYEASLWEKTLSNRVSTTTKWQEKQTKSPEEVRRINGRSRCQV